MDLMIPQLQPISASNLQTRISFGDMLRAALCLLASASAGAVDYWGRRLLDDPVTALDEHRCTTDCDLIVAYCTEEIAWVADAAPRFRTIHIYNKWCVPALWLRPALTVYPRRRWRLRIAAFASGGRDAASPLSPSLRQPTLDPSLITLYIMPAASLACTARATCPPS